MSNHDKAIEAAMDTLDMDSNMERTPMRRAIAAFLRAESAELLASYKARSIGSMLAQELNSLAAELEPDNVG